LEKLKKKEISNYSPKIYSNSKESIKENPLFYPHLMTISHFEDLTLCITSKEIKKKSNQNTGLTKYV
jgi:hypothetical protein